MKEKFVHLPRMELVGWPALLTLVIPVLFGESCGGRQEELVAGGGVVLVTSSPGRGDEVILNSWSRKRFTFSWPLRGLIIPVCHPKAERVALFAPPLDDCSPVLSNSSKAAAAASIIAGRRPYAWFPLSLAAFYRVRLLKVLRQDPADNHA